MKLRHLFFFFFATLPALAKPPYPDSPVVEDIVFDWSTHKRYAPGSDNFQLTWSEE
jgi:hypothetical protein